MRSKLKTDASPCATASPPSSSCPPALRPASRASRSPHRQVRSCQFSPMCRFRRSLSDSDFAPGPLFSTSWAAVVPGCLHCRRGGCIAMGDGRSGWMARRGFRPLPAPNPTGGAALPAGRGGDVGGGPTRGQQRRRRNPARAVGSEPGGRGGRPAGASGWSLPAMSGPGSGPTLGIQRPRHPGRREDAAEAGITPGAATLAVGGPRGSVAVCVDAVALNIRGRQGAGGVSATRTAADGGPAAQLGRRPWGRWRRRRARRNGDC